MNPRKLLIVGIDPGTTLGYAVLDFSGNLVELNSSRMMSFDMLIRHVTDIGKPLLVATDKKNIPNYVEEFARKTGAKVINPREDLKVVDKKRLSQGFPCKDYHQMDALASAVYALKSVSHLIYKIDNSIEVQKESLRSHLIEEVILHDKSVETSIKGLIQKEDSIKIIEKKIPIREISHDLSPYVAALHKTEKENMHLKQGLSLLQKEINSLRAEKNSLIISKEKIEYGGKNKKILKFKEKREYHFLKEISYKNQHIKKLQQELNSLYSLIADLKNKIIIKKLKNLGTLEFEKNSALLHISPGDILLVEDPNVASQKILDFIARHNLLIITDKKVSPDKPFIVMKKNAIHLVETSHFAFADKKEIESQLNSRLMLNKIIENYKMTRP